MTMQTQEIRTADFLRPGVQAVTDAGDDTVSPDLGLGRGLSERRGRRLLNRDGTFNVRRLGLAFGERFAPYHEVLELSWPRFLGLVSGLYLAVNVFFAAIYWLLGPGALSGFANDTSMERFGHAFFFSVQTFATIGYGQIGPTTLAANVVTVVEAFTGLLAVALLTGLIFARFARPSAAIRFSRQALVAPYERGLSLQFRMANRRASEMIDLEARVLFAHFVDTPDGRRLRRFTPLALERDRVTFFPTSWTVVHPITPESPLAGRTAADLAQMDAEFLVLVSGVDEVFATEVHARTSYRVDELVWGARFDEISVNDPDDSRLSVDISHLDDYKKV